MCEDPMGMRFCRISCFRELQMRRKIVSRRAPYYKSLQENAWREQGEWLDLGNLGGPSSSSNSQGGMAVAPVAGARPREALEPARADEEEAEDV